MSIDIAVEQLMQGEVAKPYKYTVYPSGEHSVELVVGRYRLLVSWTGKSRNKNGFDYYKSD